ncbi:hypothetical protein ACLB2K_063534 [Fragaria x ananassa]
MKFGEAFMEYLHNERERYSVLEKCWHVEYKRFKKVLKTCQTCKDEDEAAAVASSRQKNQNQISCQCQSCPVCDQTIFTELMKEASDIAVCFNLRARHLLHLHVSSGIQRYLLRFRQCFKYDQQAMVEEGRMLIEYATMNAVAIRKILKKYDKETVFNPYALSCGHLFCKSCACSAASVYIFQGPKTADSCSKCPICRETGVYAKAVHMLELDLHLKTRCKGYWKERYNAERTETVKQTKDFWDLQAKYALY